jgi:WxcM-like, C-terminal
LKTLIPQGYIVRSYEIGKLKEIVDNRGRLVVAEYGRDIPFLVKRAFVISDVSTGQSRGGHSHRRQHQFIMMAAGACVMVLDDGSNKVEERPICRSKGIYVPPGVWIELKDFAPYSACVVLASDLFDEADYIRDYDEFRRQIEGPDSRFSSRPHGTFHIMHHLRRTVDWVVDGIGMAFR